MYVMGTFHGFVLLIGGTSVMASTRPSDHRGPILVQLAVQTSRSQSHELHIALDRKLPDNICPVFALARQASPKCLAPSTTNAAAKTTAAASTTTVEVKETKVENTTTATTSTTNTPNTNTTNTTNTTNSTNATNINITSSTTSTTSADITKAPKTTVEETDTTTPDTTKAPKTTIEVKESDATSTTKALRTTAEANETTTADITKAPTTTAAEETTAVDITRAPETTSEVKGTTAAGKIKASRTTAEVNESTTADITRAPETTVEAQETTAAGTTKALKTTDEASETTTANTKAPATTAAAKETTAVDTTQIPETTVEAKETTAAGTTNAPKTIGEANVTTTADITKTQITTAEAKETTAVDTTKAPETTAEVKDTTVAGTTKAPKTTVEAKETMTATSTMTAAGSVAVATTATTADITRVPTTTAEAKEATIEAKETTAAGSTKTVEAKKTTAPDTTRAPGTATAANTAEATATTLMPKTTAATTEAATTTEASAAAKPEAMHETGSQAFECTTCPSMKLLGCSAVAPGHSCEVNKSISECLADNTVVATCLKDSASPNKLAEMIGVLPEVLCKACSVKLEADTDPRRGFYSGFLKFGPNILNGKITERVISEYRVYWSNASAELLGSPVAIMPRIGKDKTLEVFGCCSDAYEAVLSGVMIPTGATRLTVLPVDIKGLVMPVGSFTSFQDVETMTGVPPIRITGSLTLQTEDPAVFLADSSVAKAFRNGIAYAAHVSPDRVDVSFREDANLVQVHADDDEVEPGLAEMKKHQTSNPGRILVSYNITLPVFEALQSDRVMQELRNQTPSSLGSLLAKEVGKLPNWAKFDMKVLAMETPKASPVSRRHPSHRRQHPSTTTKSAAATTKSAATTTKSAAAHIWKPLAYTLPSIFAMV